jgi:hypothetical protein
MVVVVVPANVVVVVDVVVVDVVDVVVVDVVVVDVGVVIGALDSAVEMWPVFTFAVVAGEIVQDFACFFGVRLPEIVTVPLELIVKRP